MVSQSLSRMISALGLEIAAIQKRGGGTQVELRGGERVGRSEENWLYRFPLGEDLRLRDETPVRVTCGDQETSGTLVSFRDGVLLVALEADLGPKIALARLVTDDSFLVERLKDRLEKVLSGEAQFNQAAAQRVLGEATPTTGNEEPDPVVLQGHNPLNEEQRDAVRRSLGSDTIFVWGPPGTGKTTTLARVVEAHYRTGRTVLLVSNTNIAVDTALEKVADRLEGTPDFHQGAVLRQGPVVKEELRHRYGNQIILEQVVARLGEGLQRQKEALLAKADTLERHEKTFARAVETYQRLEDLQRLVVETKESLEAVRKSAGEREREATHHRARMEKLRADHRRAWTMGKLRRFLSGLDPERLEREIFAADRAAQAASDAAKALVAEARQCRASLQQREEDAGQLAKTVGSWPSLSKCLKNIEEIRSRLGEIQDRIQSIDRELATLKEEILGRCRVLATTVYRTYLGKKTRSFDVAVIDEASMLMLPLVFYPAGLATQAVVVAGDFRQLPPIVISDEPDAMEWLKRDVFEKVGIPERIRRRSELPELIALQTQYRMREQICNVINDFFYGEHPLRTHPTANEIKSRFPLSDSPLLYVDTALFHPWTSLRLGTFSRYNLFHALLVRNIVLHLAEKGYLAGDRETNEAIGAIAPYAAQSQLIQALLKDRLKSRAEGIAATVHSFQGNEKNAIIIDLTDSYGARLGLFMKASRIEEDGARLLNVALSRARHHVLIIANFEFLRAKAGEDMIVRRLLDYLQDKGQALEVESLLPLADRDWVDALHHITPPEFDFSEGAAGAFTEGTFYPAFARDLSRVRSSIVLFSPFATMRGTSRWIEPFRAALARKVAIRIVTRPPSDAGGASAEEIAELIEKVRQLGVTVDQRHRMHEKVALLDGRILWHGSLNILSHRDTTESMLRFESPAACEKLGQFISTPTGKKEDRPALQQAENPPCPDCQGPTIWHAGRYGIFFQCEAESCKGKVDSRRIKSRRRPQRTSNRRRRQGKTSPGRFSCRRPGCNGTLVERKGKYGRFLGCTRYPKCRYTEDLS